MKDAYGLTDEAIKSRAARDTQNFGAGATDQSYRLIEGYFETYLNIFTNKVEAEKTLRGPKGKKLLVMALEPEVLTLVSLEAGLSAFEHKHDEDDEVDELTFRLRSIGMRIEDECYGVAFRAHATTEAERIEKIVKMSAGSMKRRKSMLAKFAKEHKFEWTEWTDPERILVAGWIMDGLVEGPLFAMDDEGNFGFTEEAEDQKTLIRAGMILRNPRAFPQQGEVKHWDYHVLHLDGMRYPLVRTYQGYAKKFVERKFRDGEFDTSVEALNHAQSVLWRINAPIAKLIRWCYENDVAVEGIPPRKPKKLPEPPKPLEEMEEGEKLKFTRSIREMRTKNKGYVGERMILERTLDMADELSVGPFWTPMNFDYRGRVYALPSFNFQGSDLMRAMFLFEEGQVTNADGHYWVKVHVANCWAAGGLDKKPFDERVDWVHEHWQEIVATARGPKLMQYFWLKAENPFMFVAACMAALDSAEGRPVHIPISFDGSCSGLQHLCAMTRSLEGSLVNLTPSEKPQDIYQAVAELDNEMLRAEVDPELRPRASLILGLNDGKGVTRSLIKRLVMTYSYSSNQRGMRDQLLDDHMRVAAFKVITGELESNPFGEDYWVTADYLAKVTRKAIAQIVSGPTAAMDYFRDIAGLFSHEGKPTEWHTPLGFPVLMRYPKITTKKIKLFLSDKSVNFWPRTAVEAPGIDKRKAKNAASPNFVHSMDACHLMMVLLASKEAGINSVALVHDSFGCLPNDAPRFRDLIRRTFRQMYEEHDVLEDFRREALEHLDVTPEKVPQVPPKGSLDLSLIEKSDYCFA